MSGYDGRHGYERHFAFKDLEFCRFVDEDFQRREVDTTNDWRLTLAGVGTAVLQDGMACGIYRLTTDNLLPANCILDRGNIRIVSPSLAPLLCIRAKMLSVVDVGIELRLGLVDVWNTDHCLFEVDFSVVGNLSIYAESYNAGGQTETVDTGIDLDANWHIYEIFVDENGVPYWYIDGVQENVGDALDVDPGRFFQPYVEVMTENVDLKSLDIDFIKGWQRRA